MQVWVYYLELQLGSGFVALPSAVIGSPGLLPICMPDAVTSRRDPESHAPESAHGQTQSPAPSWPRRRTYSILGNESRTKLQSASVQRWTSQMMWGCSSFT
mmetsp:Transcript_18269/g.39046  ORF Transcript_18269/g.39046 Transcript_18269/m.39046 type:complete len:101 (-) Transcript_18269:142-444(-)